MKMKFMAVMIACFIFGGYFLVNFVSQMYDFWYRNAMMDRMNLSEPFPSDGNFSPQGGNFTQFPRDFRGIQFNRQFPGESLIDLLGGIVFIIAGISMWCLIREKETGLLREEVEKALLLPEEKEIMDELKKSGGEMTQKELSNRTGIPKVKLHRVLSKMEKKSVLKRYPYGMTKKVVIEKK
jgi:uncharacterized membrane protein